MCEQKAQDWLHRRGVASFYPVTRRKAIRRGMARWHESRFLPGYLFAEFPGDPIWHKVVASGCISGTLCMSNGNPGIIVPRDLVQLHAMRHRSDEINETRKIAETIHPGDSAMVIDGLFKGQRVEVISVTNGRVTFGLTMFGSDRTAEVSQDMLDKIAVGL